MLVDLGAQGRVHLAVDIGGDVLPDVFAVNPHARPPNHPLRLGANPFSCGARSRCSRARARCRRTLTAPSLIPRAVRSLANIHFFDVPEQHDVTVNLRQTLNGLAQDRAQLFLLQRLSRNLPPTRQDCRGVVAVRSSVSASSESSRRDSRSFADAPRPSLRAIESTHVRNCESPRNMSQVLVDLDHSFLRRVFRVGFIS